MKKVFTILLGMILVISMVGCVCADPTTITQGDGPKSGDTTVSYTVAQGYTVTIPESIELGSDTGRGSSTISAKIIRIEPDSLLNITITGGSYSTDSGVWNLSNNDKKLSYYINYEDSKPDNGKSPVKLNEVVLSVPANQKDQQEITIYCGLFIADLTTIDYSGKYADTLTFSVSIDNPSTSQPSQ